MKSVYKANEMFALAIGILGLVFNIIQVEFAYIIMNTGFILFGIIGLVESLKNRYYQVSLGKLILIILPVLIIIIGISGIVENQKNSISLLVAAMLYTMQLKKQRTKELA